MANIVLDLSWFGGAKLIPNILQTAGIIILLIELLFVLTKSPSFLQRNLLVIFFTGVFAFISYSIELNAENEAAAMIGCKLGYATKPFMLLGSFFLLADYTHVHIKKSVSIGLYAYFIALSLLVFTAEKHTLYYSYIGFEIDDVGSPLQVGHGPFWYVYMISTFLLFGAYVVLVIREYKHSISKQAKQMCVYMFLMIFFGILGLALFISGATAAYDTTLPGMLIAMTIMLVLLIKFNLFDSLSLSKDLSIDESQDGIIVYDARNTISFSNKIAKKIIPELKGEYSRLEHQIIFSKLAQIKDDEKLFLDGRVYSFEKKVLFAGKGKRERVIGTNYKFTDITSEYEYQQNLKKDVETATRKIKEMQRSILISISSIVEARDSCTGEHINNVAKISKLIADELVKEGKYAGELSNESIEILGETAPLHDIGKIFIADNILGKPGKLTNEEFEIMKTHASKGEKLIEDSVGQIEERKYVDVAKLIAGQHHERFDGTGYPRRLKGNEISLFARIVAVADVYDALRMKRPYKDPVDKEEAIRIIESESGSHFDPEIVFAFKNISKLI